MFMAFGKLHQAGCFGEVDEVFCHACTIDEAAIQVVIYIIGVADLTYGRPFGKDACEGLGEWDAVRPFGLFGKGDPQVAVGFAVVLGHQYIVVRSPFHDDAVDATVTGVVEEARLGEGVEVACGDVIHAVVVAVFVAPSRAGAVVHLRGVDNQVLLLYVVVEQFGCPHAICVLHFVHDRDAFLLAPVDEVFGAGVADARVMFPSDSPYKVVRAVRASPDGRVAHDFVSQFRRKPCAGDAVPVDAVATVNVAQASVGRFVERA